MPVPSLTVVMAFRAVSAPMLRSEPGTLLETVAGTITMGTQNSSYLLRAVNNSSSDRKACRAEPRALVSVRVELWRPGLVERRHKEERDRNGGGQEREPGLSQRKQRNRQVPLHIFFIKNTHTHKSLTCTHYRKIKLVSI